MRTTDWLDIPPAVTTGQRMAVVGKYPHNHPEKWDNPAEGQDK